LARQAQQPDAVREVQRMAAQVDPLIPAPAPARDGVAAFTTVAAGTTPIEAGPKLSPRWADETSAPTVSTASVATPAKPPSRRASAKPTQKLASGREKSLQISTIGPYEACSDVSFLGIGFCVSRKCENPAFREHAECAAMVREREERSSPFGHP